LQVYLIHKLVSYQASTTELGRISGKKGEDIDYPWKKENQGGGQKDMPFTSDGEKKKGQGAGPRWCGTRKKETLGGLVERTAKKKHAEMGKKNSQKRRHH